MIVDDENNEIWEEPNMEEIEFNLVNNVICKPEEFMKLLEGMHILWDLDMFLRDVSLIFPLGS